MANRVVLGKHPSFGQGLFVSRTGIDVNTATEEDMIFSTAANCSSQFVLFDAYTVGASATVTITIPNYGDDLFCMLYATSRHTGSNGKITRVGLPLAADDFTSTVGRTDYFSQPLGGRFTLQKNSSNLHLSTLSLINGGQLVRTFIPLVWRGRL